MSTWSYSHSFNFIGCLSFRLMSGSHHLPISTSSGSLASIKQLASPSHHQHLKTRASSLSPVSFRGFPLWRWSMFSFQQIIALYTHVSDLSLLKCKLHKHRTQKTQDKTEWDVNSLEYVVADLNFINWHKAWFDPPLSLSEFTIITTLLSPI